MMRSQSYYQPFKTNTRLTLQVSLATSPTAAEAQATGEEEKGEDLAEKEPEVLQSAHAQIVDFMCKSVSGEAIGQVTKVVFELQRISLLWDELWVGRLQQYSGEIGRRVKRMEDEVKKLADNKDLSQAEKDTLVKEKYNIVFKPMLFILEKVMNQFAVPAVPNGLQTKEL